MRTAKILRETKETKISLSLDLDGSGVSTIDTGIGFFDHMLEQLCYHSMINLELRVSGDLDIDFQNVPDLIKEGENVARKVISESLSDASN